ncbi:MAG: TSUP family transporter, partial [Rubrimonas sp.]
AAPRPGTDAPRPRRPVFAAALGAAVGTAGGLIGLGGAEFRLPALVGALRFSAREAVAVNLVASFVVLAAAFPFRAAAVPWDAIAPHLPAVLGMLAGSMSAAWVGAGWLRRASDRLLGRLILILLVALGCVLIAEGLFVAEPSRLVGGGLAATVAVAALCGVGIGLVSSLLGVAGGELIIPAFILLFGVDVKTAGSMSMLVGMPTIAVGLLRHFGPASVLREGGVWRATILPLGAGSILGAAAGAALLGVVPAQALKIGLGLILIWSAWGGVPSSARRSARRGPGRAARIGTGGRRAGAMNAVLVFGLGEAASAIARRLRRDGRRVALTADAPPKAHRRGMCFADAWWDGAATLDGVACMRGDPAALAAGRWPDGAIPLLATPADAALALTPWAVVVDGRVAKRGDPMRLRGRAGLTIGCGPGHFAGDTCDLAIETQWGDRLGAVIDAGPTAAMAGEPRIIEGVGRERMVYAAAAGVLSVLRDIGAPVRAGETVARLDGAPVGAPIAGTIRGMLRDGLAVAPGDKLCEVDPRPPGRAVFSGVGPRPAAIAEGAARAVAGGAW